MAEFLKLILVFNEITSLWGAKNFRFEKKMWSWWGLNYFCHKIQLSATFWFGGLIFFWGTHILRIKSCLCNNLCKHYLVEFLFYFWILFFTWLEYEINAWNHWFFFKSIWIKKRHLCTVQANSYKTMPCSRIVMKLCLETASGGLGVRVV
jgi:hypothetical protein